MLYGGGVALESHCKDCEGANPGVVRNETCSYGHPVFPTYRSCPGCTCPFPGQHAIVDPDQTTCPACGSSTAFLNSLAEIYTALEVEEPSDLKNHLDAVLALDIDVDVEEEEGSLVIFVGGPNGSVEGWPEHDHIDFPTTIREVYEVVAGLDRQAIEAAEAGGCDPPRVPQPPPVPFGSWAFGLWEPE
jgi:hypothetical protein